jgi:hypothetical protein
MLATLVGLSMLLALVGGTATLASVLLGRQLRARLARRHPQQAANRRGGWPPSGPSSPRPSASATGISGPASTASRRPSSSPTTKASPPAWPPSPAPA